MRMGILLKKSLNRTDLFTLWKRTGRLKRGFVRETVDEQAAQIAASVLQTAKQQQGKDLDMSALAAKKPDGDLKRDLAQKLEELDKLTKVKIAEHIRTSFACKLNCL